MEALSAKQRGGARMAYLRELLIFRVPEKKVQETLGQHHGGADGLWAVGCLTGRRAGHTGGVGSVRARWRQRGEVCCRAGQPFGGVVEEACDRKCVGALSICIPEASSLRFFSQ